MTEEYDEDVTIVKTKKAKKSKRVKEEPVEEESQTKKVKFEEPEVAATTEQSAAEEEQQVVERVRTKEDLAEGKKERQRVKQSEKGFVRKNTSRSALHNLKTCLISYDDAVKIWQMDHKCGFHIVKEKRHISLSYHLLNPSSIQKSLQFIANQQIGRFRSKVQGIVVAIGAITPIGLPRVIDDQSVFHMDCKVEQVVFRPVKNAVHEAQVTHIGQEFIAALILNAIPCIIKRDRDFDAKQKGMEVEINDIILFKYDRCVVKSGDVRLTGSFEGRVRKGDPSEHFANPENTENADYKVEVKKENTSKAKKPNKVTTFYSDSDSE